MQTLVQGRPVGYVRCGEILKSKKGFEDPYILRCVQCKQIYLLLESFIFHLNESCKGTRGIKSNVQEDMNFSSDEADVVNEPLVCEEPPMKLERISDEMEDPLNVVKNESDIGKSIIKIEPCNFDESKKCELEESKNVNCTKSSKQDEDDCIEDIDTSIESQDASESDSTEAEVEEIVHKPSNVSSSFVSNFVKSEENLTVLIAAFRNQPQLWNRNMPHFANKLKRREYMMKITEDLLSNHNININASQVSAVIVHLYRKYQDDLHKGQEENDDCKRQMYVKPWYLRQLSFIEPYLENYSLEILDSNHPTLSPEQIVEILKIYQNLPHLWNSNLIENHCKNKRHENIVEMLKQLETKIQLQINENLLEQYLRTIHNHCSREKRRIININKSDNKPEKTEKINSTFYENFKFLFDHVPPLRCSVCRCDFISPLHFKVHTSSHDGSVPFTCSQCNKTFKQINLFTSHANRHFEDLNYICTECGKKFANYTNLRFHMRIHTGDKPYCCEICGDSFRFQQTLSTHRRRHEKRYLHTCKICSQGFYSKMRHDDHMNSHMNIRSYICDICNKSFITKRALKLHKVVHEDVRNHACKLCGKRFKHRTGVNQHMKTHDIATNEQRSVI